jgi:hypothetical protein
VLSDPLALSSANCRKCRNPISFGDRRIKRNRHAVDCDHSAVIQRDTEGRKHISNAAAGVYVHGRRVSLRAGRQMITIGGDQFDLYFHGANLA